MKKYVLKRDQREMPERLTRYRYEMNEEQFRVETAKPHAALVVGVDHIPGRLLDIGRGKHGIARS